MTNTTNKKATETTKKTEPKLIVLEREIRVGDTVRIDGAYDVIRKVFARRVKSHTFAGLPEDAKEPRPEYSHLIGPSEIEYPSNRERKTDALVWTKGGTWFPVVEWKRLTDAQKKLHWMRRSIRATVSKFDDNEKLRLVREFETLHNFPLSGDAYIIFTDQYVKELKPYLKTKDKDTNAEKLLQEFKTFRTHFYEQPEHQIKCQAIRAKSRLIEEEFKKEFAEFLNDLIREI